MRVFNIGDKVLFRNGDNIIEGTIERNNGVNAGTYTVSYKFEKKEYKNIFDSNKLFDNQDELNKVIIEEIESNIKWKQNSIERAKLDIERYTEQIKNHNEKIKQLQK